MVKAITPFSTRAKEGATDAPLGDFVKVEQEIISTANAGFYDKNTGKFEGVLGSDKLFTIDATHEAVPNGGAVLSPQATPDYIDMTGFNALFIAIKPTNGGNYRTEAVMGPATNAFANLSPVNAAAQLRGNLSFENGSYAMSELIIDAADTMTVDVWNIFYIANRLADQKLLQFKLTNNSGAESDITFAYMRMV